MKPLKDLLVISIEQAVAAPFCTMRLAESGARVIKIERKDGDFARNYDQIESKDSSYFIWLNQGKESLILEDLSYISREISYISNDKKRFANCIAWEFFPFNFRNNFFRLKVNLIISSYNQLVDIDY